MSYQEAGFRVQTFRLPLGNLPLSYGLVTKSRSQATGEEAHAICRGWGWRGSGAGRTENASSQRYSGEPLPTHTFV